jgi:hypothetical protein
MEFGDAPVGSTFLHDISESGGGKQKAQCMMPLKAFPAPNPTDISMGTTKTQINRQLVIYFIPFLF